MSPLLPCAAILWTLSSGAGPYLGQRLPGSVPEPFAPGIVNTGLSVRDIAMTPDGSELYFSVFIRGFQGAAICSVRRQGEAWAAPEVTPFCRDPRWHTLEPCVSPDGTRFLFASDRPLPGAESKPGPYRIWSMRRQQGGWTEPTPLSARINGDGDSFFPSMTRAGVLYFLREKGGAGRILRAEPDGEDFREAQPLPSPIADDASPANPFVDPDERMLLYPLFGRKDALGRGGGDYYASFRKPDGGWTRPQRLEPPISSEDPDESSIKLSPDGRVLFFGSSRPGPALPSPLTFEALLALRTSPGNGHSTIWWVAAEFLEPLRRKALAEAAGQP
jgi:hypothetical protein